MRTDITTSSTNFVPALMVGNRLREKHRFDPHFAFAHRDTCVPIAIKLRNERLPDFLQADAAAVTLFHARVQKLERPIAVKMLTTMYRALGLKATDELSAMVEGSLDMFESDEIALAVGTFESNNKDAALWLPLEMSPAVLSLACRKLIATSKYQPRPAEVRVVCEEMGRNMLFAYQAADELREYVRKADAVLLQFAPNEWRRPYQTPHYRPVLARMLELHDIYGDGSAEADHDDNHFRALVEIERRKLVAIEAPKPKRRIAASRKRQAVKKKTPKLPPP